MCGRTRPAGWAALLLFLAATGVYVTGSVLVFEAGLLNPAISSTNGLVDATLLCSAVALLVIVGGIVFGIGKLRPGQVGLHAGRLPLGLGVTLALWLLAQFVGLSAGLIDAGSIAIHRNWPALGAAWIVGALIGQLFGNALFEEIAYRGFLLPQVYLKLGGRWSASPKARLAAAVVISQAVFALMHAPIRLHQGTSLEDLPANLLATVPLGVFFCWVYLRTGNLFIAVGVHALINKPTPLLESAPEPQLVLFALAVLMLLLWPWLTRRFGPTHDQGQSPQSSSSQSSSQDSSSDHSSS
jgi:membrane protease YdiL (CAAX protease family)